MSRYCLLKAFIRSIASVVACDSVKPNSSWRAFVTSAAVSVFGVSTEDSAALADQIRTEIDSLDDTGVSKMLSEALCVLSPRLS